MGEEKREKDIKEEAKEIFKRFYERTRDIQKATTEAVKEIADKTLKGVGPSKETVREIAEGIQRTFRDISSKASEVVAGVLEGVEEVTRKERRDECLKIIKERRSVTFFDPRREVPDEVIKEILNTAALTPSGYNLQPWEVIVVKSKEKKKKLRKICYDQAKVEEASANIVLIANLKAAEDHVDRVLDSWVELGYITPEERDPLRDRILKGWESPERRKRKAIRDTAMFGMSIMIIARLYGLETHPMEGFDEAKLKRFLKIGKDRIVPMIIAIGYKHPEKTLLPRAYRFTFDEFGRIV
ncbi:MAG: nitroreductase family protein [Aquificota bacterium]|nr:nitroreductase family protein [Aquificota bacterium]